MTAPAFDLGAEVSAATAQQLAAISLGRAQMAQEILNAINAHCGTDMPYAEIVGSVIELCEKEAKK